MPNANTGRMPRHRARKRDRQESGTGTVLLASANPVSHHPFHPRRLPHCPPPIHTFPQNRTCPAFLPGGQIVWRKIVGPTDWIDSGFRTQTTEGTDASNIPNWDSGGRFKFLDPGVNGSRTYKAQLYMKFKDTTTHTCFVQFNAKSRIVYCVYLATSFECWGKCWFWKQMGLTEDQTPAETTDPSLDRNKLLLRLTAQGWSFGTAYECVTPYGKMYFIGHGNTGYLNISGTVYAGFKGPSSQGGTGSGDPIYDLNNHSLSHNTMVDLYACHTGDAPSVLSCLMFRIADEPAVRRGSPGNQQGGTDA